MGCLWESTYFDMYGDCVWSCLDPERAGSACFCGGPDETASCYKGESEWRATAVPIRLTTSPCETDRETNAPVVSGLNERPRKRWALHLSRCSDYKMSAICSALRSMGVSYEEEEAV